MYNIDVVGESYLTTNNLLKITAVNFDLSRLVILIRDGIIDFLKEVSLTFTFRVTGDLVVIDEEEVYFFQGQILTGFKTMEKGLCLKLISYLSAHGWMKVDFDPLLTRN